jgi:hypothetical protein
MRARTTKVGNDEWIRISDLVAAASGELRISGRKDEAFAVGSGRLRRYILIPTDGSHSRLETPGVSALEDRGIMFQARSSCFQM